MSKQSQDQDEQQAPSGDAQGGADAGTAQPQSDDAGKASSSASRRSRRRGKGGSSNAQPQADSAPTGEAVTTAGQGSESQDTVASDGGRKAEASRAASDVEKAQDSKTQSNKAQDSKAQGSKAQDSKGQAGKSSAGSAASGKEAGKATSSGGKKPGSSQAASGKTAGQSGGSGGGSGSGQQGGNSKGGKAGALALVLVIVLAIAVAVFGWLGWQRLQSQQQSLAEMPAQPATQAQVDELSGQLQGVQSDRESTVASLREEFESYRSDVNANLDQVLQQLSQQQDTDEREWLHAEAAYLLRLANQRLQLERDVEGAAALLRTADQRLKEASNPALMPVRREIASELAALRSVPSVDRTGLFLTLNALQEQIAGRPLAQDVEEVTGDASIEDAPEGGWKDQLSTVGQELKDLVTVRKHDEALEALISPEQESYLRQSVRLVLEQVQLALLKEDQQLFDATLDKLLKLINGYYDTDDSGVQGVVSELEELQGRSIRPQLPDISGSQQALQEFIQNRFESSRGGQGDNGQASSSQGGEA
ncbi:uroporphyrinogen-III C-methyltransferase [Halomonas sabkhae]|uniref:uroporphyrinogen-III C-methyltransferase n=1 Tax=Halomonas sabkhae TaxID=626223 RepID=UPI0025B6103D|nr:uroporphyrinogen-III C-methyltransferase [Halomonas sabkhae]MDN3523974.1 uroporphyrinogen-III C-methyltransferase [Halomonas sabkhae]